MLFSKKYPNFNNINFSLSQSLAKNLPKVKMLKTIKSLRKNSVLLLFSMLKLANFMSFEAL
jgi:hypothetical protein